MRRWGGQSSVVGSESEGYNFYLLLKSPRVLLMVAGDDDGIQRNAIAGPIERIGLCSLD